MSSIGIEIVEEENADNAGAGAEFAKNFYSINKKLPESERKKIRSFIWKLDYAGRTLIDTGDALYLVDHTDQDGLNKRGNLHGFSCKFKIDKTNISDEDIEEIKNLVENGNIRTQKDANRWAKSIRNVKGLENSDSISSEIGETNSNNVGLAEQTHRGESIGGLRDTNSTSNSGESFIKTGYDGTKYPRYIKISEIESDETNGIEYLKSSTGEVLGWVEDGKIHLIKGKFDTNTLIHEYAHLWLKALKLGNKEQRQLYASGILKFEKLDIWKEVSNDPNYANLDRDGIFSECVARVTGKRGTELLEKEMDKSLVEEIKDWIFKFFKHLKGIFTNKNLNANIGKMSAEKFRDWFADGVMGDLLCFILFEFWEIKTLTLLININFLKKIHIFLIFHFFCINLKSQV